MFGYMNLAKLSFEDGHEMISKLIELTGGEEETQQTPTNPDDGFGRSAVNAEPTEEGKGELEREIDKLADMLQICVSDSIEIVHDELGKENITEGTRAMLVKSFAATLFIEASRRGLGR
jgi:hypothetical protein